MTASASHSTIVWFRQDLRLADNRALLAALALGGPVIPVFILDPTSANPPGGAQAEAADSGRKEEQPS